MEIIKKRKNLSKSRLKLQEKSNTSSGLEEFPSDQVLQVWNTAAPTLIAHISEVGLPLQNQQIRMITTKAFNSIAFLDLICSRERILKTYICCYSIDYESGVVISRLAEQGKLGECTFLISNIRNSAYRKKEKVMRDLFLSNPKIRLVFCGSHAKLMAIQTEKNHYVIETSANFAANSRIEQYLFENSKIMFDFHSEWIDNIDKIATEKELAGYDFSGKKIRGENKFKDCIVDGTK
ncbi:MAG: hypothetical protein R3Y49_03015 [Rikenellaceae bacterium]